MKIRSKVFIVIMVVALTATAASFFSSLFFTSRGLNATLEKDMLFAIELADGLVSNRMQLIKSNAETMAERLRRSGSDQELTGIMKSHVDDCSSCIGQSVFDRNGIIASYGVPVGFDEMLEQGEQVEAAYAGMTAISSPFYCAGTGELVMNTYTPLGPDRVLSLTMSGLTFSDLVSGYKLWDTGNIYIIDGEGTVIADVEKELVLTKRNYIRKVEENPDTASEEDHRIAEFVREVLSGEKGVGSYSYKGIERLGSYKRITGTLFGWRVIVAAPLNESPKAGVHRGLLFAALFLFAGGIVTSLVLSGFLERPYNELEKLNEKVNEQVKFTKVLLDAMPLACRLWNKDFEIFECNHESLKFFNQKSREEFIDRYFSFYPEYQSDGVSSQKKAFDHIRKAFKDGRHIFNWTFQMPDGELVPTETTLVRVPYGDDYAVAGYTRDLREYTAMMKEIERRNELLSIGNRAAEILLTIEDEVGISDSLMNSMEVVGRSVGVDRVHIWRNAMIDGKLYFVHTNEWLSDFGRNCVQVPIGLKYPYSEKPNLEERVMRGEYVSGPVSKFSDDDQDFLKAFEMKTILIIPLFLQNNFWGLFSIDDCRQERNFSEVEINILHSVSLMLANAVNRNLQAGKIIEAYKQLQIANNAKSDFLAKMSHEMRTPLNAVLGMSELSLENSGLDGEVRMNLEKIYNSGATLLSIVNDVLDISKIEAGKLELMNVEYDVPSLINDAITQNILRIGEKPINFILEIGEGMFARLYGDELRVRQILNNLLTNAIKYTNEGAVELNIGSARDNDDIRLIIKVRDTGRGIKAGDIKKLFYDYSQFDMEFHRKIEGTGLGLPIAKKIAEMMDGSISVESEYGKGSVFTVNIRQKFVSEATISPEVVDSLKNFRYSDDKRSQNRHLSHVSLPYARVLIVDDNVTNLDVAKGLMKPYGMQIDCVDDGRKAVDAILAGGGGRRIQRNFYGSYDARHGWD